MAPECRRYRADSRSTASEDMDGSSRSSLADDHVMREHAANRFVKAAADGLFRNFEVGPGSGSCRHAALQRPLRKIERRRSRIGLEVGPRAVALNGIAPLRNLPFELHLGLRCSLRQIHLHATPRRLDVADVDHPSERSRPQSRDRPSASVQRQMIVGRLSSQRGDITQVYLPSKSRFCGRGIVVWFHG